jgi:hypothetical protein
MRHGPRLSDVIHFKGQRYFLRGSATSAPASSYASTMRAAKGIGRRRMGNRGAPRRPHRCCELTAITRTRTGARPR